MTLEILVLITVSILGVFIMTAIEKLNANYTSLVAKIDEAIALVQSLPNNDAAINTVADGLEAQKNKIQAVINALNA